MRLYNLCRCKVWVQQVCPPCGDGDPAPQGGAASSSLLPRGLDAARGVPRKVRKPEWEEKTCGFYFPAKMWKSEVGVEWREMQTAKLKQDQQPYSAL